MNWFKDIYIILYMNKKTFENLNLNENLLKGIFVHGFIEPSNIQIKGIETINTGNDCILQSSSGTGKTATYLLGILNRFDLDNKSCQGLIITPTRELASQIYDVANSLSKYTNYNIVKCIGGTNIYENRNELKKASLIIGTIGRIYHMIEKKYININHLKILVLDEADNILNYGINNKLQNIFDNISDNIQVVLISATLTKNVFNFSKKMMIDPTKILLKNEDVAAKSINQFYLNVETEEFKFDTLLDLYNIISASQTIIFCNEIEKIEWLEQNLTQNNFSITTIHSKLSQTERNEVLSDFREGKTRILLTTDLLSRGIDIPLVNLVVNYDLPIDKETYIHRIGRCGRFDKKGVSISMVKMLDPMDVKLFNKLKHFYKINLNEMPETIEEYF